MLRRAIPSPLMASALLSARTFIGGPNAGRMSPETARKAKEEDRSDLDREFQLRERFFRKIQQGMPNVYTNNAGQQQGSSQQQQASGPGGFNGFTETQYKFLRLTFFGVSLYLLLMLSRLRTPDSPMMLMQGLPWWQAPVDVLVAHTLIRHIISFREQRNIKSEFETQAKMYPTLTFTQFLNRSYPALLAGYRTSQPEILAALTACFAYSRDMKIAETIAKAARTNLRDPKAAIDAVMEGLKTDFPQVFQATVTIPVPQQQPAQVPYAVAAPYSGGMVAPQASLFTAAEVAPPNVTTDAPEMTTTLTADFTSKGSL